MISEVKIKDSLIGGIYPHEIHFSILIDKYKEDCFGLNKKKLLF